MAEAEKKFEGTSLGDDNGKSVDADVDALIQGALKEIGIDKTAAPQAKEKSLAGTQVNSSTTPPAEKKAPPPQKTPEDQQYDSTFKEYKAGDIASGVVLKVDNSGALVDIGYKSDALLVKNEYSGKLTVGDKIKVMIEKLESKEGYVLVSKNNADDSLKWKIAYDAYRKKSLLEASVVSAVRGGLLVNCNGIRGFIPASQVSKKPGTTLESFVSKNIPVKIIQVNHRQGKIVMSHSQAAGDKEKEDALKMIDHLEMGQIKKGRVSSLKSFGAFVDLGGIEGLVHLSELSWKRVKHPSEVLKVGEEVEVLILGVDKTAKKISLGMKELQPDPWEKAAELYKQDQVVKIKILRFVKFGAFVELEMGVEGLVHVSDLSWTKRISHPKELLKKGEETEAIILNVDEQNRRIA
ncbi:MAG: S1 RNA-binding domain-containing protein, partial [Candidatus Saganbacteria bacterium]|nr:S1 RNA-binding domain-containing protein [Candidatus Saganbacteria bacterium]